MNMRQQELFDRLEKVMDDILKSPETEAQVTALFEEFVISIEEIAEDLATTPDEQVAKDLREIVATLETD